MPAGWPAAGGSRALKRVGNLFEQVVSFENLLTAARLAMQGCGNTPAVCRFAYRLEPEILRLQEELESGTYRPGRYRYFQVFDPKQRLIAVAPFRDRVVHHAVVRILTPVYERCFIFDSYATRPGKGTHAAIRRARGFVRAYPWYLKADVEKYFDNVDHDILMAILARKIKDQRLLELVERIIRNVPAAKGLPIGNLTSQFLANVYLDPFDHEIKDRLGIRGYVRYMDDFILFGRSRQGLLELRAYVDDYLRERLRLSLKINATWLNRSSHGLSFLGMRIFPRFIRIRPENRRRSLKRMAKTVERWQEGRIDEDKMAQSVSSIAGHLRYFCPAMALPLVAGTSKAARTG